MMRMEIALILVLVFVAFIYFGAGKRNTPLHKTFSSLLLITPLHLAFDASTVYTVNHLETVPPFLNEILHRLFIGTMVLIVYLFYRYISILVEEETKKLVHFHLAAKIYLIIAEFLVMILPMQYMITEKGNYSYGIYVFTNIRIEKAKKLLLSTSLSVTEIAEHTGYGDYRVFTKVFKKTEGITPSQFRREFLDSRI